MNSYSGSTDLWSRAHTAARVEAYSYADSMKASLMQVSIMSLTSLHLVLCLLLATNSSTDGFIRLINCTLSCKSVLAIPEVLLNVLA